jgi:hypothetical protein
MTIVTGAEPLYQVQVPLEDDRVVEVRNKKLLLALIVADEHLAADLFKPPRMIRTAWTR